MTEGTPMKRDRSIVKDLRASVVVFLVALPLCLGISIASGTDPITGLLAGVIGGIIVGSISGSQTSVTGPAAGLTAVVMAQIALLGSFEAFLLALFLAGLIQIVLGALRLGFISGYFPTAVINGLLAAIGVILILKQIPHVLGHDTDPEGEMSFLQLNKENTFSEFFKIVTDFSPGPAIIGIVSVVILLIWDRFKVLKKSPVPSSIVVVAFGVVMGFLLPNLSETVLISKKQMVDIPIIESAKSALSLLKFPDFSQLTNQNIYIAAFTIAIIASLETLLNVEAVDKLDPEQRATPTSRELIAQGIGNSIGGLIGAIPVTAVIVRGSVNINAGGRTKLSTIAHGFLLLVAVLFVAKYLNMIPIACLAAILLMTGFKLASFILVKKMWRDGWYQFLPFVVTVVAIVWTDLLIGVVIGLVVSLSFILYSNMRKPIRKVMEEHPSGKVTHILLGNQVSFLNKGALDETLNSLEEDSDLLIDASETDYLDPDILNLIRDYTNTIGPARGVRVSLRGFKARYGLEDRKLYNDHTSREFRDKLTPEEVVKILIQGHERFRSGRRLYRDLGRQAIATASGQHPMAAILSCIDSRTPAEILFDTGLGDIFSVRIAGNVARNKVLGSLEYAVAVAGAKLIFVLGHTRCGAVNAALRFWGDDDTITEMTNCDHLAMILHDIQQSVTMDYLERVNLAQSDKQVEDVVSDIARANVLRVIGVILKESVAIRQLVESGQIAIVGGLYDVSSTRIEFLTENAKKLESL